MSEPTPITSAEVRRVALLAAFLVLPLYLATASWTSLQSPDPRSAAIAGWQFATTGSLAMDEGWAPSIVPWPAEGADGRVYSNRFPGVIGLAVVGYSAAEFLGALPPEAIVTDPLDVPMWPATLMAVLVALAASVVTWRLFRETGVSPGFALAAAGVVALGSPLWSVSADGLWTHGATHALLAGSVLALARSRIGLASILGGLSITFRPHLVVPLLVVAALQRGRGAKLSVGAGAIAGVAATAAYSIWLFGQPLPAAGYRVDGIVGSMPFRSFSAFAANIQSWLFDPNRGVLVFVPLVLIAIPRLPSAWKSAPRWARVAGVAGLSYAVVQLGLIRAIGGHFFFGHRTTIEALVLASPLLVLSIHEWVRRMRSPGRIVLTVAVGFSLVVHAYGAFVDIPPGLRDALRDLHEDRIEMGVPGVGSDD
jgi:hypothetical protein